MVGTGSTLRCPSRVSFHLSSSSLGIDQRERSSRGALYPFELVKGREELNPRRQVPQVHESLDERDARAQNRQVHDELVRRPTGLPSRGLLEEVAADRLRTPPGDPAGRLFRQAWRLFEVLLGPNMPLRPVRPEEQDVAWPDGLARSLKLPVRSLEVDHVQDLHRLRRGKVEDDGAANHPIQCDLVYGFPVLDGVQRALDVRPRMQAHQVELRGHPKTGVGLRPYVHLHPEIRRGRPLEAVGYRRTEVYDLHHEKTSLPMSRASRRTRARGSRGAVSPCRSRAPGNARTRRAPCRRPRPRTAHKGRTGWGSPGRGGPGRRGAPAPTERAA